MSTMEISMADFKNLKNRTGREDYDIENYDYSRKCLSNIMRFNATAKTYSKGLNFSTCLKELDQQLIHDGRRTEPVVKVQGAIALADKLNNETRELAHAFQAVSDDSVINKLDDLLVELLSKRFE